MVFYPNIIILYNFISIHFIPTPPPQSLIGKEGLEFCVLRWWGGGAELFGYAEDVCVLFYHIKHQKKKHLRWRIDR